MIVTQSQCGSTTGMALKEGLAEELLLICYMFNYLVFLDVGSQGRFRELI